MKDYKRLTERYVAEEGDFFEKGTRLTLKNAPNEEILERLAELEDKIEDGTLVELPCTVGDTIYEVFKNHKPPFIQQTKVEKIIITEKGLKLKLARNSFYETSIASLGKIIFLTEDEARKKLKELEK
jgi:hypothetical protein|nr:MAG TPA: hypothetical protein [Caudoviricetes sp.]